jgi:hypothetical protein
MDCWFSFWKCQLWVSPKEKHKPTPDYSLGFVADVPVSMFYWSIFGLEYWLSAYFYHFWRNVHLPFLNSFALSRAPKVMKGATWHCLPWVSAAHIASSKTGLTIIDAWLSGELVCHGQFRILSVASCIWLQNSSKRKNYSSNSFGRAPLLKGQN